MIHENKLEKLISYIGDSVYDVIASTFDEQASNYFEGKHITDDGCVDYAEWFDGWYGVDAWLDKLKKDKSFRDSIQELSTYVAHNREPQK